MGCGCNKNKAKKYEVTYEDGRKETYSSRSAASAAVRRSSGKATMKELAAA